MCFNLSLHLSGAFQHHLLRHSLHAHDARPFGYPS
jgi:hypothetical protein